MASAVADRFAKWPLYSGIAVVSVAGALWALPSFLVLASVLPFLCLLVVVVALLGTVIWCAALALLRGQWRLALSMAAFPLMVCLAVPVGSAARSGSNELRFLIDKNRYDTEVAKAKREGKFYTTVDDWSVFFNANSFIVWDVWDKPEEVVAGFKEYQSFGGHFYLVSD